MGGTIFIFPVFAIPVASIHCIIKFVLVKS